MPDEPEETDAQRRERLRREEFQERLRKKLEEEVERMRRRRGNGQPDP